MPESVLVQLLAVGGVVTAALITAMSGVSIALLNRTRQHAKAASDNSDAARRGVENDHSTNLRDDLDRKFAQVLERLDRQDRRQVQQGRQIAALFAADRRLEQELEQTQPRPNPRRKK